MEVLATCSTAGIAKKGSSLWVMSAGHCADRILTPFYQWDKTLGRTHLNSKPSGYDFLLINVSGSEIARFASNRFYSDSADTQTGLDASFSGSHPGTVGLPVCKVGVTTHRTCGTIAALRRQFGGIITTVVNGNNTIISGEGDSGGAWFTQSRPYRLVGIHQGGTKDVPVGAGKYWSANSYFTPWEEVASKYGLSLYTSSSSTRMD